MKAKEELLRFVFDNEFITRPRLKNEFELLVNKVIDEAKEQVKNCNLHNVNASLFNEALRIMRALAEHQNGTPLIRYEKEYNETMQEVWDFLEANET